MSKVNKYKNRGFTLVEVLICVGIIGIIAAITIPALISSTSEKALEAQRKALHSRMSQAFGQIKNLKLYEVSTPNADNTEFTDNKSALNFLINSLSKTYKLAITCDSTSIRECGVPDEILDYYSDTDPAYKYKIINKTTLGDTTGLNETISKEDLGGLNADVVAFKTANGESVLMYYNPKCVSKSDSDQDNLFRSVCVNMIYDLNGRNGQPNAYGEDIGVITVFYPTEPHVVMPILYHDKNGLFAAGGYQAMLSEATEKGLQPPTIEELTSILVNKNLTKITKDIDTTKFFWSSSYTADDTTKAWAASLGDGLAQKTASGTGADSLQYFLLKK